MICMVLQLNHFDVSEAASPKAPLRVFEETAFEVVIVDIFLEGASGFDVIATMRQRRPDLPVVAISGMTSINAASQPAGLTNVVYLQKPFRPNDLIGAIQKAHGAEQMGAAATRISRAAC